MRRLAPLLAVAIVPLIVLVKAGEPAFDLYTWYKSAAILILGAACLYVSRPNPFLVGFVALACLASSYGDVAWWGFPQQYLGGGQIIALAAIGAVGMGRMAFVDALACGSIPIALLAIAQWLGHDFSTWPPAQWIISMGQGVSFQQAGGPPASTLYNANYVGLYAAVVLPILYAGRRFVAMAILGVALVACHSRGGMIGACAGVLAVAILDRRRFLPLYVAIGFGAVFSLRGVDHQRIEIWSKTLPLITVFGSGPAAFPFEFPQVGSEFVDKPHNAYLQVAHAFGWVGLLVSLAWISCFARRCLASRNHIALGGLVGLLVAAGANDIFIGVAPIVAVLLGL